MPVVKYSPEVAQKAEQYLQKAIEENDIPFVEQLAIILGVTRETLNVWQDQDQSLSDTVKKIKDVQLFMLQKGSLLGDYNPASAIFQMKANHGLMETSRQELAVKELPQPILAHVPSNNSNTETTEA